MRLLLAGALLWGALNGPAAAQSTGSLVVPVPGVTFFNRPGATMETQRADLDVCRISVGALTQPMPMPSGGDAAMDDQARIVATLKAMHVNYENCMVARGWRVVQVNSSLGEELGDLETEALAARLASMVGAEAPEGRVVRRFANELAERGTEVLARPRSMLFASPRSDDSISLSLQVLPESYLELPRRRARPPMGAATSEQNAAAAQERREHQAVARRQREALLGRDRRSARATDDDQIAGLPPDSTLVILRVLGIGRAGLVLVRSDATENENDSVLPVVPMPRRRRDPALEETYVYAVPPGHWRITAINPYMSFLLVPGFDPRTSYITSLCLGAPSFDVAAGEIVFAGSFAFGDSGPRLDLSLEPARAALAAAPALAERVRAASYVNGDTFECGGGASYLYAYEIDGAPFREGYALGSRAVTPASTEPAAASTDAAQQ